MRLDPTSTGDPLRNLGGGAVDAANGQTTAKQAADAQKEAEYESLDSLILRRMRAALLNDAADSVGSFADAAELAERTKQLMLEDPTQSHTAQGTIARDRLRNLLSGFDEQA